MKVRYGVEGGEEMYIGVDEIIKAAAVISALTVICGFLITVYKWYARQNAQDAEIAKIKKEQCIVIYGILACLKGLKEQGCNGPVTEAVDKIEKHINKAAHDEDET